MTRDELLNQLEMISNQINQMEELLQKKTESEKSSLQNAITKGFVDVERRMDRLETHYTEEKRQLYRSQELESLQLAIAR